MSDLPITDSEYLASNVYPTLEKGIEELLKVYLPNKDLLSEHEFIKTQKLAQIDPVKWLAKWLKHNNESRIQERKERAWESAVLQANIVAVDSLECCRNLVQSVRQAFWPIQVPNTKPFLL